MYYSSKANDSLDLTNKNLEDMIENNKKLNNLELSSKDILMLIQNHEDSK